MEALIFLLISGVSKGICDKIKFQPSKFWYQTDWWLAKGRFAWDKRVWAAKYIFSFLADGWHLFDALRVFSFSFVLGMAIDTQLKLNTGNDIFLWAVIFYIAHGIIFEIIYSYKGK